MSEGAFRDYAGGGSEAANSNLLAKLQQALGADQGYKAWSDVMLADDPDLTCRIPGMERVPMLRVVADARLRTPATARLVATATAAPSCIVTAPGHPPAALAPFIAAGVAVLTVPAAEDGGLDLKALLAALARRGVTRVLAEGGAGLAHGARRAACRRRRAP